MILFSANMVANSEIVRGVVQHNEKDNGAVYLAREEVKKMSIQIAREFFATVTIDGDYVSMGDEVEVVDIINQSFEQ